MVVKINHFLFLFEFHYNIALLLLKFYIKPYHFILSISKFLFCRFDDFIAIQS